jgi:hypothetical protein
VPLTERGSLTIALLGLNRQDLIAERLHVLIAVGNTFHELLDAIGPNGEGPPDPWMSKLMDLVNARSAYAGAARAAFNKQCEVLGLPAPQGVDFVDKNLVSFIAANVRKVFPRKRVGPRQSRSSIDAIAALLGIVAPDHYAGRKMLPEKAQRWLSRVEISDFKAIEEVAIDIPEPPGGEGDRAPALMLLGENASGKSSVLEAIGLALLGTREIARVNIDGKDCLRRNETGRRSVSPRRSGSPLPATINRRPR